MWTEIRPAYYTALGWCCVWRLRWLALLMDQGQGDLVAEMSRAAISSYLVPRQAGSPTRRLSGG